MSDKMKKLNIENLDKILYGVPEGELVIIMAGHTSKKSLLPDHTSTRNIDTPDDLIGFSKYVNQQGITVYGCRGFGKTYDYLYHVFFPATSYKCVREDFPWDYFIFEDETDEKLFVQEYIDKYGVLIW